MPVIIVILISHSIHNHCPSLQFNPTYTWLTIVTTHRLQKKNGGCGSSLKESQIYFTTPRTIFAIGTDVCRHYDLLGLTTIKSKLRSHDRVQAEDVLS